MKPKISINNNNNNNNNNSNSNVGNRVRNYGVCMRIKRRLTFGKSPFKNNKLQGKGIFCQNLMVSPAGDGPLEIAGVGGGGGHFSPKKFLQEKLVQINPANGYA